jgi:hypothetical protein
VVALTTTFSCYSSYILPFGLSLYKRSQQEKIGGENEFRQKMDFLVMSGTGYEIPGNAHTVQQMFHNR